jgi:SAM-dependent methyltransferase
MSKSWFANWFDTEYYHELYGKKRSDDEAQLFVNNLVNQLAITKGSHVWDMSCGKGRHVRAFAENGISAIGTDLSKSAIHAAIKSLEDLPQIQQSAAYAVHDMRQTFAANYFDVVGNFFTSFGYFKNKHDDVRVLRSAYTALKKNGIFILDFLNAHKLLDFKPYTEHKTIGGVNYDIKKYVANNTIFKEIAVQDKLKIMYHHEQVYLYTKAELERKLDKQGFKILFSYGNYQLQTFIETESDRCIIIAQKQ